MKRDFDSGYTLYEMIAIIAIMGVVTAISLAGTQRLVRSNRLVGATNTMVSDLRYARSLASAERRNFQMVFQSGGYSIVRVSPVDTVIRRICPSGVTCSASGTATFFSFGLAAPTTITLTNADRSNVLKLEANGNVSRN